MILSILLPVVLLSYVHASDGKTTVKVAHAKAAAGHSFSMFIKPDGGLWVFGSNQHIILSDDSRKKRQHNPIRIGMSKKWAAVWAGYYHCVALKTDGSLWAWGKNDQGQNGDGTRTRKIRKAPVRVGTAKDWGSASAGGSHTVALKTDGSLWAWGNGSFGQLGDGTEADRYKPIRVGGDTDWVAVSAGEDHTVALKSDGSLWAWGANICGALGDGTPTRRHTPIRVGADTPCSAVAT
ncbi:MAG: hypothetical protein LBH03_06715, partial [Holophagales bacterium]|nr:hypothetical protein [Holophagales bacterium]